MKHQLQTIREFIESAHEGEWASYVDRDAALTALSELERMAGEQEPVAWINPKTGTVISEKEKTMWHSRCGGMNSQGTNDDNMKAYAAAHTEPCFAAPPARQPHERHLLNLLARIHGDGGHYTAEHGLEKSVSDADQKVADLHLKAWEAQQPQRITPAELAKRIERGEKWQLDEQPVGRVDGDGHVTWFAPIPEGGANLYAAQQPQAEVVSQLTRDFPAVQQSRAVVERQTERYRELMGDDVKNTLKQPQYEAGDMASAHNDGFRAGVASVVKQPQEEHLTITWDEHQTRILAVTMQDEEGRILKVLAEAPAQQQRVGTIGHVSAGKTTLIAAVTPLLKAQQPQAEAVPSDVVLVPVDVLHDWKSRVNTLATLSTKAERYAFGIKLKQDIADAAQGEKP